MTLLKTMSLLSFLMHLSKKKVGSDYINYAIRCHNLALNFENFQSVTKLSSELLFLG